MKKAQSIIEIALLMGFVAIISIAGFNIMHKKSAIESLSNMSKVELKK